MVINYNECREKVTVTQALHRILERYNFEEKHYNERGKEPLFIGIVLPHQINRVLRSVEASGMDCRIFVLPTNDLGSQMECIPVYMIWYVPMGTWVSKIELYSDIDNLK